MSTPTATHLGTAVALELVQLAHDGGEALFERLAPHELDRLDTKQLRQAVLSAAHAAAQALRGYDGDTAERFRSLVRDYRVNIAPREGPMDVTTPDGCTERTWVTRRLQRDEDAHDDDLEEGHDD